ncbi:Mce protein [Mycolicibacillus trivialis]
MATTTPANDVFDRLAEETEDPDTAGATTDERDETARAGGEAGPDGDSDRPAGEQPSPWRRRVAALLVGAVVVGSLGAFGYVGWRLYEVNAATAAGEAALAAAREYAVTLTTLDADDIDSNYTRVLDGATGDFKEAYALGAVQLRQMLIDNQATGNGVVIDAAVKSATKTKVEVLLFVDQSITNAVRTEPRIDRNRIQMTMELVDNRWLASQVELM